MARLKKEYGSVMDYVRDQRLKWTDLDAKGAAFEDPGMWLCKRQLWQMMDLLSLFSDGRWGC